MSVVSYNDIHKAVTEQIEQKLNKKYLDVQMFPGSFSDEELKTFVVKAPAIRIALLNIDKDSHDTDIKFVAFVVVKPTNKDPQGSMALAIIQSLMTVVPDLDFEWLIDAGDIKAESLYTASKEKLNVNMWAIEWTMSVRNSVEYNGESGILLPDNLEDFKGYDATHYVGSDEVKDIVNMEG